MQYRAPSASVPYLGDESGEHSFRPDSPLMRLLRNVGPVEPERFRDSLEEIDVEPEPPSLPLVSVPPRRLDMGPPRAPARTALFLADHIVTPRLGMRALPPSGPLSCPTPAPSTFEGVGLDSVRALVVHHQGNEASTTYPTVRPSARRSPWQTLGVAVATSLFTFSILLGLLAHAHGRAPWSSSPKVAAAAIAPPAAALTPAPLAGGAAPAFGVERALAAPSPAPRASDVHPVPPHAAAPAAQAHEAHAVEHRAIRTPIARPATTRPRAHAAREKAEARHATKPPRARGGKAIRATQTTPRAAKRSAPVPADELAAFQRAQLGAGF